jgi:photosystem II stability/assembly factor-like uncharacterized protein
MKRNTVVIVALLVVSVCSPALAQWIVQHDSLPPSVNPDVEFSTVDLNVCWGVRINTSLYIRTTTGGTSWRASIVQGAAGLWNSSIAAVDANTAWVAMWDSTQATTGGVFKTTNGGTSWTRQTTAFPGSGGYPNVIHFFDPSNGVCVGDPNGGNWEIYTTTNGGALWTRIDSSHIPSPLSGEVGLLSGHAAAGNSLWFTTFNTSLYRTTNRGMTWTVTRNVIGGGGGYTVAFQDSLIGLACSFVGGNKISFTFDGGETWAPLSVPPFPPPGLSTRGISYVPGTPASYMIASNYNFGGGLPSLPGSAYTTDFGINWTLIDHVPHWRAKFVSPSVGWSAGANDTVYKWAGPSLPVAEAGVELPRRFELHQNYPNPFNPVTNFGFGIVDFGFVSLKVYDLLGREVATLVNENRSPGTYEVQWNAEGLSSGVYFYRLSVVGHAGPFVATRKLILLR